MSAKKSVAAAAGLLLVLTAASAMAQSNRIPPDDVTRPAQSGVFQGDASKLLEAGKVRHGDTSLSPIGRSCNTCHLEIDSYNATFKKPWPHFVESVKAKTGLERITAEGMVQFCMISAMGSRPLAWESEALAALTEFVMDRHRKVVTK